MYGNYLTNSRRSHHLRFVLVVYPISLLTDEEPIPLLIINAYIDAYKYYLLYKIQVSQFQYILKI
nr:MAG TPA: hypothetical protein [Caudoviricetes sp.]